MPIEPTWSMGGNLGDRPRLMNGCGAQTLVRAGNKCASRGAGPMRKPMRITWRKQTQRGGIQRAARHGGACRWAAQGCQKGKRGGMRDDGLRQRMLPQASVWTCRKPGQARLQVNAMLSASWRAARSSRAVPPATPASAQSPATRVTAVLPGRPIARRMLPNPWPWPRRAVPCRHRR